MTSSASGSATPDPASYEAGTPTSAPEAGQDGYQRSLNRRQVQMIAIGGAIGTGLFLGSGARLQAAGPALALVYLVCGLFTFLILRAMGELVMHRPTSGSFVTYAGLFLGEKAAFVAGWMSFLNWAMTGIADITAVALYMRFWPVFAGVPQWVFALAALAIVTLTNLVGVKWFGEMEFWFSALKVAAIAAFLVTGTVVLGAGWPLQGHETGLAMVAADGGWVPHGLGPALILVQGVVFAFSGVELLGTAAGEAEDAHDVLPRAINSVIWRIALFYVGSVLLLACLLPSSAYRAGQSPFVTVFAALGIPGVGTAMNIVVLSAALSSLNSGLYSTGRVVRALAQRGSAPAVLERMSAQHVPVMAVGLTVAVYAVGVGLNALLPAQVFEIVLNVAALGILTTWGTIVTCQIAFRRAVARGEVEAVAFRLPGAPFSAWATLAFLAAVLVLMGFDYPNGTITVASIPVVALALALGWWLRGRAGERAA